MSSLFGLMDMTENDGMEDLYKSKNQKKGSKKNKGRKKKKKNVNNVKDLFVGVKRNEKRKRKRRKKRGMHEVTKVSQLKPLGEKTIIMSELRVIEAFPEGGGVVGDESGSISLKTNRRLQVGQFVQVVLKMALTKRGESEKCFYKDIKVLEMWKEKSSKKKVLKGNVLLLSADGGKKVLLFKAGYSKNFLNFKYMLNSYLNGKKIFTNIFQKQISQYKKTWTDRELSALIDFDIQFLFPFAVLTDEKREMWISKYNEKISFVASECEGERERRKEKKISVINNEWSPTVGTCGYSCDKKRMEKEDENALRKFEGQMKSLSLEYESEDHEVALKDVNFLKNFHVNNYGFLKIFHVEVTDELSMFVDLRDMEKRVGDFKWFKKDDLKNVKIPPYVIECLDEIEKNSKKVTGNKEVKVKEDVVVIKEKKKVEEKKVEEKKVEEKKVEEKKVEVKKVEDVKKEG